MYVCGPKKSYFSNRLTFSFQTFALGLLVDRLMQMVQINKVYRFIQHSLNQPQLFLRFKVFLDFKIEGLRLFLDMATIGQMTIKTESIRKSIALELYRMEVVKFTDYTYQSLSDDTIIHPP